MTDTITLPRSVVEQALDAMNLAYEGKCRLDTIPNATDALRTALEQPQTVTDCHQSQPQGEQEPNPRWPSNASEVRAFLSGRVATERYARDDHQPDDNDTYTLSAHDLLEAIDWWTDFDTQPKRQPLTDEEISDLWGMQLFRLTDLALAKDFARDIERAHGIGGEA